ARIDFHFHAFLRNGQRECPKNSLHREAAILRSLPVAMEVQADEAERTPALWSLPGPTNRFIVIIDARREQRMNPRLHEVEPIIEFIKNREIVQSGRNGMFAISELNLRLEHFVFALRTTARAAEQLELAFDVLRVCGPHCPMQRYDATFALRQSLECGVPLWVILNPPRALGDEHNNAVRLIDERRAFGPRLIGFHHGDLEPLNRS